MPRTLIKSLAPALLVAALVWPAQAADNPGEQPPAISCGNGVPGGVNCIPTKKELKEARQSYARGERLQEQRLWNDAFDQFDRAARLVPKNAQYLAARELVKAQIVFDHVGRGNTLMSEEERTQAAGEFRAALVLDPENHFAQERLAEATRVALPQAGRLPALLAGTSEIHLQPGGQHATFHYRGDVHGLYAQLASAYGVKVQFDDPVREKQVRFYVDDVDFFTALSLAGKVSKTMWAALGPRELMIADDNQENHRRYDHMSLVTLQMPVRSIPQAGTDMVTMLKAVFPDIKNSSAGPAADLAELRIPTADVPACLRLWDEMNREPPQVMLDINIYEINHQLTKNIGMHIPDTFNLYNIPAAALAGLAGQNIQQLVNQLIASGGINQAGSGALSGLLAQLSGGGNSIFSQPLATFGGGLTFSGLSLDQLSAALSVNESWVRSLEHLTMHGSQGDETTFHIGTRYPILNASYAPIYNSPQIAQVLGNQSYVAPFPSVSYEDLGLNVKAKPTIHGNGDVSLHLEMQVRALTGQSANGVPVISNQEYSGSIRVKDGEPAVLAGQVSQTEQRSMTGIPGLGFIPALNQVMVNNTRENEQDELMIVITPHVMANTLPKASDTIWLSESAK